MPSRLPLTADDTRVKREIVDLKMKDWSYNEIVEHFAEHRNIKVTKHDISDIILEAGERAKHLNGIYDSKVRHRFKVIEIDEVFQGRSCCYLGVVDKKSHYVLKFSRMDDRARETFKQELEVLTDVLENLEIVITDGFPAYKTLVPEIFDGVVHLLCHVHSYRIFLKESRIYNKEAADALKKVKNAEDQLVEAKRVLALKRRQLKRLDQKVTRIEIEYDAYRKKMGFKKYSKKAPWTPERCELKRKLNSTRVCHRSKKKTVKNKKQKIQEIKDTIERRVTRYMEKKQVSLQTGRILSWFKRFLSCPQDEFLAERENIIAYLQDSKYPMAGKMLKFIHDNPQLQPITDVDLDEACAGFNASTNIVEHLFGLARPLLDKARRFSDSPQSNALLEIYRLKCNMSSPFTGPHRNTSPLQRASVNSRHESYLDALFPLVPSKMSPFLLSGISWSRVDLQFTGRRGDVQEYPCPDSGKNENWLKNKYSAPITWKKNKS